ncbi:putative ABC transport system ATP-binding protein [Opitutus sp. GAS368]|jgi:ABC-type lipoprotein export system ATPase subunit|nr:putative ABC transport system ATP-binding protein [Opitutus sp. GAS368]
MIVGPGRFGPDLDCRLAIGAPLLRRARLTALLSHGFFPFQFPFVRLCQPRLAARMNPSSPLLQVTGLRRSFVTPEGERKVIVDVPAFSLAAGQQLALRGESGSGKTTFLHLIAGILAADAGTIQLAGRDMATLGEHARDRLRAGNIGYIFQTFNLLQGYSCLENVLLGMAFGAGMDRAHSRAMLERVGLGHRLGHYPRQLSTGQQQRVAVARALANHPKLVLADEPTGNLDHKNARESLALIRETCRENGAALLLVSHDPAVLGTFEDVRDFAGLNQVLQEAGS